MTFFSPGNPNTLLKYSLLGNISNIYTKHLNSETLTGNGQWNTYNTITKAPCSEFTHVRVILKNLEATPPTMANVLLAVTNTATSLTEKITPSVGNTVTEDGTTGWVTAKFSGTAGPPTMPAAGTTAKDAGVLFSDWMELPSVAPVDGTSLPYVMCRVKPTANFSYQQHGTDLTDQTSLLYTETFMSTANGITTPANLTNVNSSAVANTPIFGFEFLSSSAVVRVLAAGDSITAGTGSTPGNHVNSWVPRAYTTLKNAGVPVNLINYGAPGALSASSVAIAKRAITNHLPAILLYSVFSPNDITQPTQASVNSEFNKALDLANYAYTNKCMPVFVFLAPNDGYTSTSDAFRKSLITRCKAAGIAVIDMTTAVGDGASPERFQASAKFDNTHPNDTGYAAMATVAVAGLQDILSRNLSW